MNCRAPLWLVDAMAAAMVARGRGAIVLMSSLAGRQGSALFATYAATKAFVLSFSEALWAEYRGRGVHVAALCPGAVETAFIAGLGDPAVRQTSTFATTLSPEAVAQRAVQALRGTSPTHIVGLKNWLMAQSIRLSPRRAVALIGAALMRPARLGARSR